MLPEDLRGTEPLSMVKSSGIVSAINVFSFAYVCHHTLLLNYHQMANKSVPLFGKVATVSLMLTVVLTILLGLPVIWLGEKSESNISE